MKFLTGKQAAEALHWIDEAVKVAQNATCNRAKCGAVIVKDGDIIGSGFNSPPGDNETERRCEIKKSDINQKVTDKTCCVHAEQRAVMSALRDNPKKIKGGKLYFARFKSDGERALHGETRKLYCTICTKMMLDAGISEFVLLHQDGVCAYPSNEYNKKSFDYR